MFARLQRWICTALCATLALPAAAAVRFLALGDAGEGNRAQDANGNAMKALCARKGCDFVLYLGDNFYGQGITSPDDLQFQQKFELPYAGLDLPFYAMLGNHDYGDPPIDYWKPQSQVDYTSRCGTEFIVSGAGSKTTTLVGRDANPAHFEYDRTPGFLWASIEGERFSAELYDLHGKLLYRRSFTRCAPPPWRCIRPWPGEAGCLPERLNPGAGESTSPGPTPPTGNRPASTP